MAQDQGAIRHAYVAQFDAVSSQSWSFGPGDAPGPGEADWFDLASLTKPLCTAPLVLTAVAQGRMGLTFEIGEQFAQARMRGGRMLLWQLLNHSSGLRAYDHDLPPQARCATAAARAQFIAERMGGWIQDAPGAGTLYSDLGYAVLGVLLEAVYGGSLDAIFGRWLHSCAPGLRLGFAPVGAPPGQGRAMPNGAEDDHPWRVHDPLAAHFGGAAGHAGLWSTGPALVSWLQTMLWRAGDLYTPDLAQYYLARPAFYTQGTFTLGLDTVSNPSTAGSHPPADAVGHLGFTGCSFWYSPQRGMGSVLLTDRAAQFPAGVLTEVPPANRAALFALRQAIHGACWS